MTFGATREARTVVLFASYAALVAGASWSLDEATLSFFAKEGPSEHCSHAVLLAAALAWTACGARARRPQRAWPALAIAAFLSLVLLEETDWGAVYRVDELATLVRRAFPEGNVHNSAKGASYLLFALPLAGYFLLPRSSGRLGRACAEALGSAAPSRSERWVFFAISFIPPPLTLILPRVWERALDEMIELPLYGLMLLIAVRALRAPAQM